MLCKTILVYRKMGRGMRCNKTVYLFLIHVIKNYEKSIFVLLAIKLNFPPFTLISNLIFSTCQLAHFKLKTFPPTFLMLGELRLFAFAVPPGHL